MTSTEVVEIVNVCKQAGVRDFEFGGLKLSFGPPVEPKDVHHVADPALEQSNLEENEMRIRVDHLEELKLRDPLAYEEIVALSMRAGG